MLNLKSHFGVPHPSLSEKHEKNLVSISLVNCDLQVSEQQLAFLQLMKTVLCVSCSAESRERGQMTLGAASLLFPPLTDVLWGCVYGVIEGRWGRQFVGLRKCGGQQEHLIVAKPFEDKPRASFTVCKNVVDHPDTWDQSCSVPSSWVKGNKCGSTLACTCLCHRDGSHQAVKKLCVPWGIMMWSVYNADCLCGLIPSHCSWSPLPGSESVVWGYWRTTLALISHIYLSQSRIHGTCWFALQILLENPTSYHHSRLLISVSFSQRSLCSVTKTLRCTRKTHARVSTVGSVGTTTPACRFPIVQFELNSLVFG